MLPRTYTFLLTSVSPELEIICGDTLRRRLPKSNTYSTAESGKLYWPFYGLEAGRC